MRCTVLNKKEEGVLFCSNNSSNYMCFNELQINALLSHKFSNDVMHVPYSDWIIDSLTDSGLVWVWPFYEILPSSLRVLPNRNVGWISAA
ncbi:MAG: hypothetical protein BMS9Abin33_0242 [Gammaproteobacteria bacterium]|nr:MAG: hypothetical protein BMS9Abin33_0242 [Gammaproteobacteria bacterium]